MVAAARDVAGLIEDPRQQLPVTSRPALLAGRRHEVVRRELVEQLDIGDQAGASEHPLEQVVAQECVLRDAILHCRVERVEIVDPLAGEAALLEEVLVDVGDGGGVGIDPSRAGEDPLEQRPSVLGRQRGRDAWLQHTIPSGHAARRGIEPRLVQRVGDRADQSPDGTPRHQRVGVERDDVSHIRRWRR